MMVGLVAARVGGEGFGFSQGRLGRVGGDDRVGAVVDVGGRARHGVVGVEAAVGGVRARVLEGGVDDEEGGAVFGDLWLVAEVVFDAAVHVERLAEVAT